MASIRFWAAKLGTTNQGKNLSLAGKDRILDDGENRLATLPDSDGIYSSTNGAKVSFSGLGADTLSLVGTGMWNTTKTLKVAGDITELGGKALSIQNIVHTAVNLAKSGGELTTTDAVISIDGSKRGHVYTGNGNDSLTIGIATNNGGWSNHFKVNTSGGDDTITIDGAVDGSFIGANLTTDGRFSTAHINSGEGDDTITINTPIKTLHARLGEGNDTMTLSHGDAIGGDVTVRGGDGDDTLLIQSDISSLDVRMGKDNDTVILSADTGDSLIRLGAGNDLFSGGGDDVTVHGGSGEDTINSGAGNDFIHAGHDRDRIDAGGGEDVVYGGSGDDFVTGGDGSDTLYGGQGNDIVTDISFYATAFDDAGNDLLFGNAGNDYIVSTSGKDTLWGGAGNDIFYFPVFDSEVDAEIKDFVQGQDLIELVDIDETTGKIDFSFVLDFNTLTITQSGGNTYIEGFTSGSNIEITGFTGTLSESDFVYYF